MGDFVDDKSEFDGGCEPARLHALDSLRALAAMGVVAFHYAGHFGAAPLSALLAPLYHHGEILVDFFFVLSGFVLARAYWHDQRSSAFADNVRERIARLYPLHLATLCVVCVMQWMLTGLLNSPAFVYTINDTYDFVLNLLLLHRTGLERGFSFNGPSWSISTEFVVNVLFLAAIALPRNIFRVGLFALFAVLLAAILEADLISGAAASSALNDICRTIVGFCCGVVLHRAHSHWAPRINLNNWFADGLALAAMSIFLCYSGEGERAGLHHLLVVAICFPVLIVGAIHGRALRWILKLPPLVYLGTISYSIYLVHFPLQLGVHLASVAFLIQMPYDSALFLAGFMLAVIGVASVTYRRIEVPGKQFLRKRRSRSTPSGWASPRTIGIGNNADEAPGCRASPSPASGTSE